MTDQVPIVVVTPPRATIFSSSWRMWHVTPDLVIWMNRLLKKYQSEYFTLLLTLLSPIIQFYLKYFFV